MKLKTTIVLIAVLCGFIAGICHGQETPPMRLRLLPLVEGMGYITQGESRLEDTSTFKVAEKYGLDLRKKSKHQLVAHNLDDQGRLFLLFYNQIDNALADRPYLIQRVKMTENFYDLDGKPRPTHTKYLVEVFKTFGGSLKGRDEHFGGYAMGANSRRVITKELEIGFGEIPGRCEGKVWPFASGKLYRKVQGYDRDDAIYNAVKFDRSVQWTIKIGLTSKGQYRITVRELGIDLPKSYPSKEMAEAWKDSDSRRVVLTAGRGCTGGSLRGSNVQAVRKALGPALEVVQVSAEKVNHSFPKGITVQVRNGNQISTLFTRSSFAGRTKKGIRLGDNKAKVRRAYGRPKGKPDEWQYRGIVFRFDHLERVKSIFIFPT